jgi:hypothetical protein
MGLALVTKHIVLRRHNQRRRKSTQLLDLRLSGAA